jgi:transcriptional regulator with XRE-family HTH domain
MRNNAPVLDEKKVRHAMIEKDYNQAQLANKIGADPSRLSVWLSGKGNPDLPYAFDLADALGVTVDSLRKKRV